MTTAVWRFAHLVLAIFSFLFLLVASVTGVILAMDAVNEKMPPYRVAGFNEITLARSLMGFSFCKRNDNQINNQMKGTKIKIKVGSKSFTATLLDNNTASI